MAGVARWCRGVKDQRAKGENGATCDEAILLRCESAQLVDGYRRQTAQTVRPIDNADRSVLDSARIEVHADTEHVLKHCERRLDVRYTRFLGPWPVSRHFNAIASGDREVLMLDDFPVGGQCLVKKECAHREALLTENGARKAANGGRCSKGPDPMVGEKITCTASPIDRQ